MNPAIVIVVSAALSLASLRLQAAPVDDQAIDALFEDMPVLPVR